MEQPVLTSQRLIMRPVEWKDQQKVFEGFSNPVITKHMTITYNSFEATAEQMEWYFNNRENGSGYAWVAGLKDDPGSFIGVFSIYYIRPEHKRCEIGYWTFPEYWGKGYVAEGFTPILEHASASLHLHRIAAEVEPDNYGSIKVLQKLKFEKEGILKDYEVNKEGKYVSLEIWARLFR